MIHPKPITRADAHAVAALGGARLRQVTYHYLPHAEEAGYAGAAAGLDADLTAVALEFEYGDPVVVTWAMEGDLHGLALLWGERSYSGTIDAAIRATDHEGWRQHRGAAIASVHAAWQSPEEGIPESLWAIRLGFPSGSLVVALGTADPDLEYMPDELVVVFDEALARSYRPRGVSDSSWGSELDEPGSPDARGS